MDQRLKIYGFSTQENGCAKYRLWQPLAALERNGLAEVRRDPDTPQAISVERCMEIFEWADIVWCQPFSELWAASIFAATRDNLKKKIIVDLDDNIWAVHPMNIGSQHGELKLIKSYFDGKFEMYWDIQPIEKKDVSAYKNRLDGTVIQDRKGKIYFLRAKAPDVKLAAEFFLGAADAVTTTNEVLAAEIRKHTSKPVYVLPNCLYLPEWRKAKLPDDGTVWVGWCGSVSHYPDLQPVSDVLDGLMKRYPQLRVQIMGSSFDYFFPVDKNAKVLEVAGYTGEHKGQTPMFYTDYRYCTERWPGRMRFDKPVPVQEYPEWMNNNWQSHIGIAPIEDNVFNQSKSELKWLEYAALGVPTVASDVGPYRRAIRNGIDGIRTENWEPMLAALIEDPSYREELVQAARQRLATEYNIDKQIHRWLEVAECTFYSQGAPDLSVRTSPNTSVLLDLIGASPSSTG
jgi:glycosyltransferase involved in cell wall biosynthesis